MIYLKMTALLAGIACSAATAFAGTMEVSPINIEITGGGQNATETLVNKGNTPINAQVRVYKWIIKDGQDQLVPTTDVVASPPALKILPGAKATVRVVRLSKATIVGEEVYRLLIDDIPPPPGTSTDTVAFAVRHNIPVFFQAAGIKSNLAWTAKVSGGELTLTAANSGALHSRLAQLAITLNGVTTPYNGGLAGYVLGGAANSWKMKAKALTPGSTVKITAVTNDGPVDTTVQVQ